MALKPVTHNIPTPLFKEIRATVPLICVDLVITSGKEFFVVKRLNDPEKGKWFFPGGRIYKNEKLLDGAKRKLKEETGMTSSKLKYLGVYEYFSKDGCYPGINTHTVDFVFHAPVTKKTIRLDSQSSEGQWFTKIQKNFHPELKEFLGKLRFTY
jgi:colanic acid biosynthesis protein WcaH